MVVIKGVRKNDLYALLGVIVSGLAPTVEQTILFKIELCQKVK